MLETLKIEIRRVVDLYCDEPTHRTELLRALTLSGFALHPDAKCRVGLLASSIYRAAGGHSRDIAVELATAVELQMEAGVMFDNVADGEMGGEQDLTAGEALALAITLMGCAGAAASEVAHQANGRGLGLQALRHFHGNTVRACAGQFLDARLERCYRATTNEAMAMTAHKAGSLGRLAATFAASVATNDVEAVDRFGEFGADLLTYLQVVDDLRDACPEEGVRRDLVQNKKTLPLVFFYNSLRSSDSPALHTNHRYIEWVTGNAIRGRYEESGAEAFCAIVAETFLNRAKVKLMELKDRFGAMEDLEELVRSVEISGEALARTG